MLKEYFNPNLSGENQTRISDFLFRFSSWTVFPSYGQARAYRATQDYKHEDGRYSFSIVKYDGFYYLMDRDQRHRFMLLLHASEREDAKKNKE